MSGLMNMTGQPERFEALLRQELAPGERLLWHSRAIPRAKRGSMASILFAIPWTAFAVFWTAMAFTVTRAGAGAAAGADGLMQWVFPAFGLPFIAVGLFMFARPLLSRMAAARTAYGITNQRAIQLMARRGVLSESVPLTRIATFTRHERSDGSGTLQISLSGAAPLAARTQTTGFELGAVPDVRRAEHTLRQAMSALGRESSPAV